MQVEEAMRRAVELSFAVLGSTSPNPPVGAVALDVSGVVVGEGASEPAGGAHAEVLALAQAAGRAHTMVTTLEPCDHTGRTGPCSQALVQAGVREVVIGCAEPTTLAGGGVQTLRAAGVEVRTGVLEDQVARGPLQGWLHRQRTGRPFVTWKYAATLDGRSAAADGTSRWITGPEARTDVHLLRAQSDAIVVGIGTVLADDPALTVRLDTHPLRAPLRVVVDSSGRTPDAARVRDGSAPTWIATGKDGPVDLHELLVTLAARDVVTVLLEGGPTLAGSFVRQDLVDRVVGYIAPALLGAGPTALQSAGIDSIDQAVRLHVTDVTRLGEDVRLTMEARRP